MAVFKCKMCGAALNVSGSKRVVVCEYCGAAQTVSAEGAPAVPGAQNTAETLCARGFLALEDCDWRAADGFFEQALNSDAANAEAYLGKLMAEVHARTRDDLKNCPASFAPSPNYRKAVRFGDDALKAELDGAIRYIEERNASAWKNAVYVQADQMQRTAITERHFSEAAEAFRKIAGYRDADARAAACEAARKDAEQKAAQMRIAAEKAKKKKKKRLAAVLLALAVCVAAAVVYCAVIKTKNRYETAVRYYTEGNYEKALALFSAAPDYGDTARYLAECTVKTELKKESPSLTVLEKIDDSYYAAHPEDCYALGKLLYRVNNAKALSYFKLCGAYADAETYRCYCTLLSGRYTAREAIGLLKSVPEPDREWKELYEACLQAVPLEGHYFRYQREDRKTGTVTPDVDKNDSYDVLFYVEYGCLYWSYFDVDFRYPVEKGSGEYLFVYDDAKKNVMYISEQHIKYDSHSYNCIYYFKR